MCTCSCTEEYTLLHYGHESGKLHFEPSQNATVTNCDNSGILAVAFCDLSHFVIMAVTAQTESNNTENVFRVLGRVHMFTFDMNMKSFIVAHFGVISLLYLIFCMYISHKAHNRFTRETVLIVYPLALPTWIWKAAFWTVTKCDNHILRQFRNTCRRILRFVAFCDHGHDGTNRVQ